MSFAELLDPHIVDAPYLKELATESIVRADHSDREKIARAPRSLLLCFALQACQSCWLMSLDTYFGSGSDRTSFEERGAAARSCPQKDEDQNDGKSSAAALFFRFCREPL